MRCSRVLPIVRLLLALLVLASSAACGDRLSGQAGSGTSGGSSSASPVQATPRATSPATLDCTVSWARSYGSLDALVDDSDVVVRARATANDQIQLKAFGANGAVSYRSASRITFGVLATLSPVTIPITEVRVIEDVCPGLDVVPGDEWILFLHKAHPRYVSATGDHYSTLGGPQGQIRLHGGMVNGPFFKFQRAVHQYEGASTSEVERAIAAIRPIDRAAARALVERYGWRVVDAGSSTDLELPADVSSPFGLEGHTLGDYVAMSRRVGLDLSATPSGLVRLVTFLLEADRPSTESQYTAHVAYSGGRIVGAWVVAGVPWTWTLFGLDQRSQALALAGK